MNLITVENVYMMKKFLLKVVPYILLSIILIVILISLYIRFKFRFWREQPVFHIYDFYYYLFPVGIIKHELPSINKYCNFQNIDTIPFSKITPLQKTQFVHFINKYFLQNNENVFIPKIRNITPYFTGHNSESFFSFYKEDELLTDLKTNSQVTSKKIISVMTTKPLNIQINNGHSDAVFQIYYVDYLCVHKDNRKQGIAQQIIQTHEYNQRHLNKKISVSLFKRDGELTGIVPLCVYDTVCFDMTPWKKPEELFPDEGSLLEVGKTNIQHLLDFLKENNSKFDICITPELSNIMELIKTENIFIYMIVKNSNVVCCYFFKKSCTFIKKNKEILSCFASINDSNENIFIHGFKSAVFKIKETYPQYQFLTVENISHNDSIIANLKIRTAPYLISPTAYFFYNFAYSTLQSNRTFILL